MTEPLGRVAVFWHYDSLPPPSIGGSPRAISCSTYDAIFNIRQALYKFGITTSFRAYVSSMPLQTKWELQSHGVTVIECLWNASETMITADMFSFALDNPPLGTTLVLISSSFTLAYTVSVLGARRYRVALISTPDPHNGVLLAQASEVIDWRCLLSRDNANHPRPPPSPPAIQDSSAWSCPENPTRTEHDVQAGTAILLHNVAETLEHSFTISDLNLAGSSGEQSVSPPSHPTSVQLELQQPPPMDDRPPSRQIEEAILTRPVVEDTEETPGPPCFDSRGQRIELLTRPFNRSVSELTLGGNVGGIRPRTNSLQDDRRFRSPSGNLTLEDPVALRSLPTPGTTPPLLGELASGKLLNVDAPPFIPVPGLKTPPAKPLDDTTTTISPPAPDHSSTVGPVEKTETRSPSLLFEGRDSISSISSASSTASTVKPAAPVTATKKSGPLSKQRFTAAERRAVETVINVLLEMKGKGEARASPAKLSPLILAKDRAVYKNVGRRANRFWRLIDLGVQMDWLEAGPENAWIDVGMGWTEDAIL